jgi:hypothetical protein
MATKSKKSSKAKAAAPVEQPVQTLPPVQHKYDGTGDGKVPTSHLLVVVSDKAPAGVDGTAWAALAACQGLSVKACYEKGVKARHVRRAWRGGAIRLLAA